MGQKVDVENEVGASRHGPAGEASIKTGSDRALARFTSLPLTLILALSVHAFIKNFDYFDSTKDCIKT